jgi:hypothetical protein
MGENSGPAPATENRIHSIPSVRITAEQARMFIYLTKILSNKENLGDNLQCAICMDDFKENDDAKRLPCSHHFHEDCISRWLRLVILILIIYLDFISFYFSMEHVQHVV